MNNVRMIGIDLAKTVFQLYGVVCAALSFW